MWLIPPSISSACAPESACSMREFASQCPEAGLFVTLSGKAAPRPFSWRGWLTRPWSQHLFGAVTLRPSMPPHGLSPWIASLRASPASPTARPVRARARKTSAGSGRPSRTSSAASSPPEMPLARYDRSACSWRTSAACLPLEMEQPSAKSWPIWPTWGSMRNGACFQRPAWAPRISVSASSSSEAARWTSPASADAWTAGLASTQQVPGSKHSVNLSQEVVDWPTPSTRDHKSERGGAHHEALQQASGSDALGLHRAFAPCPTDADWRDIEAHLYPAIEPGLRVLANGLALVVDAARADQLRAIGNGVVPLQAATAFTVLNRRLARGI